MSTSGLSLTSTSSSASSGIDVTAVVNQILDSERAPERLWQNRQSALTQQAALLASIGTDLADLKIKVDSLKDITGALTAKSATSSNTSVVTAQAQTTAVPSNHLVVVNNLASTSSAYTDPVTAGTVLTSGSSFSIQVGSDAAVPITIDSSNNTLATLADYINANVEGISASVVNDVGGERLAIVSNTSGTPGNVTVTGSTPELTFHNVAAVDASLSVDGIQINSSTNTVTGVLQGVTLNLTGAAPGQQIQLIVGTDTSAATQAVNDFVNSYNTAISAINQQFVFDTGSNTAGPLASDSFLRSIQSSLLSDVTYSITGNNGYVNLASIGVDMNDDGTLSVDSTKLNDTITNHFTDFQNFFQTLDSQTGFAYSFSTDLLNLNSPSTGLISLDLNQIKSNQTDLTNQINDLEDRLAVRQQFLINQYSQIDAQLRQLPLILQQISAQVGTLSS